MGCSVGMHFVDIYKIGIIERKVKGYQSDLANSYMSINLFL